MKSRSPRHKRQFVKNFTSPQNEAVANQTSSKSNSSNRRHYSEAGIMTETALKLCVGLFISLVASISLVRLIPYHFAQSIKLKELKSQVKETEYRVKSKKRQLMTNFDLSLIHI